MEGQTGEAVPPPSNNEIYYLGIMALVLVRLCRAAGVHLDCGRVVGLTYINPNLTEPAIGSRYEDDVRLVGRSAHARAYNIDRFLCDV
jgi:hypothetical protein